MALFSRFLPGRLRVRLASLNKTMRDLREGIVPSAPLGGPSIGLASPALKIASLRPVVADRAQRANRTRRADEPAVVYDVSFEKSKKTLRISEDETILEAAIAAGLDVDYSCQVGGCGACRLRLISGEVEMQEPNCLDQSERDQGQRLICIAQPLSDVALDG